MTNDAAANPGETADEPLVLALDIRPPAGPPSAGFVVCGLSACAVSIIMYAVLRWHPDFDPTMAEPFGVLMLLSAALATIVWVRRWMWTLADSDTAESKTARAYEAVLRRSWQPITYDGHHRRIETNKARLHMEWVRPALLKAELAPPRAIVIARPRRRRAVPLRVEPLFHEPIEIDAIPARSIVREPHRFAWSFVRHVALAACVLGALFITTRTLGTSSGPPRHELWRVLIGMGLIALALGMYFLGRVRALGWWREILAGPSYIQTPDRGSINRYTPDNTTLVVRPRRCFAQGILAILCTDGNPKGPPSAHIVFFGFDDPGFIALWSAWINPLRADHLIGEDVTLGSAAATPSRPQTTLPK